MKILFFTENFPPETNAAATRVYERALYWVKWGHDVTVITCQPNFPQGRVFDGYPNRFSTEMMDGMRIIRVRTYIAPNRAVIKRVLDFLSYMVTAYIAAKREPVPDVVVSTSPQFFAAVAAWRYAAQAKCRYVFELGDLWPASIAAVGVLRTNFLLRLIERLELRMYRDADTVVALTQAFKDNLVARNIPANKIAVVINGVDLWRYAPSPRDQNLANELGIKTDDVVIGYIGTHGMAHALGNILDAAAKLRDHKNIKFLFAGAGAERDALMTRAKTEKLENVIFLASQPKSRMPAVWSQCDVAFVHLKNSPIFAGVIPSKIFEAMAMGLPVLFAGPTGEGSKIVKAADAGPVIGAENPDALATSILDLATHSDVRRRFAANSLAAAPAYSREAQARKMIDVLAHVVGEGAKS